MHRIAALALVALAVACYAGADAPVEPTPTPSSDLRILGGAVECDGCSQLEFSIGGPDLQWVTSASFVNSDDPRRVLRAQIELRRFTGDSGVVLQARASFSESAPIGDYDLELLTPGRPGSVGAMRVERALRVTRVTPPGPVPPGPPVPPVPPGPPVPPAPPLPSGNLRISVAMGGADLDSRFHARSSGCDQYYEICYGGDVSAGQPLQLRLPATAYSFTLADVAPNCVVTSPNPATVTVVADSTVELAYAVSCVALGFVEVSVPVSGSDVQEDFTVSCTVGDCGYTPMRAPGPLRLTLAPGAYLFTLPSWSLQPNCQVSGPSTLAVQVSSGATARISFPVSCLPFGEIRVSVNAADPSHTYRVQYPAGCDDYYTPCATHGVRPGFPVSIRVPAGVYGLTLLDVPANCRVTSANPANVAVTSGTATELAFDIACP
jgi:hypothetical protein